MRHAALVLVGMAALTGAAHAAVPVNDGAILDRRSDDAAKKVEIKLISDQVKNQRRGIDCSTRTPGKADDVKSPTKAPEPARGTSTLEKADPTIRTSPAFAAPRGTGSVTPGQGAEGDWTAAPRADREQTSRVLGGIETVQETIQPNRQVFQTMSQGIGRDGTLMEAMDRNSAVRTQTGLTFNQALQGVAYLAQAFNLGNLANAGMTSQATRGLTVPVPTNGPVGLPQTIGLCPAGMTGQGTAASPCVSSACSTTAYGTAPAPGCVTRRATDTAGNVSYQIYVAQTDARSAAAPMSTDELMAAVSQYESR